MRTISEDFVVQRRERWNRLKTIIHKLSRNSYAALTDEEIRNFSSLYRTACNDLAEARMLRLSREVIGYLNHLIGKAHKHLYSIPVIRGSRLKSFLLEEMPRVFRDFRIYLLLSVFFFFGSYAVSMAVIYRNPALAETIAQQDLFDSMEASYSNPGFRHTGPGKNSFAVSYYIQNNVTIAFLSFATGVLGGLGTVYLLLHNGIMLGSITGYLMSRGYGVNFLNFVTAHGVFELTGLVVAGAAGLLLGHSILRATPYRRQDWLNMRKRDILKLLIPGVILITMAAFIEGNLSPSPAPYWVKTLTALLSLGLLFFYFGLLPHLRSRE